MTTTRAAVRELAQNLDRSSYVDGPTIAQALRHLLESTEEQPTIGTVVAGPTDEQQLRLSALGEAVTAAASHMSTEDPDETVRRARAFYAFLAGQEDGTDATEQEAQA